VWIHLRTQFPEQSSSSLLCKILQKVKIALDSTHPRKKAFRGDLHSTVYFWIISIQYELLSC
jgi:hypothetical protein